MNIKYATNRYRNTITRVKIIHETPKTVTVEGMRTQNKVSKYCVYHDSFEQAKRYLLDRNENDTTDLSSRLKKLNNDRVDIHGLKETDVIKGQ